jgi:hypothetical protein
MRDSERIKLLTEEQIIDLKVHLDRALSTDSGSGDHWILISVLDRLGFRTNSSQKAMDKAEEIIVQWERLQR